VDDHLMRVTDVIRGEEWLPSTAKHVLLYRAFGWQPPRFAHLPLLLSDQGGKLSKRHADASVKSFVEAGFQPEALVNFVAFLGWTPEGTEYDEVMTMEQLAQAFSLERVHKGGASVSRRKLEFLNSAHVGRMLATTEGAAELQRRFVPFVSHLTSDGDYALRVLRVIHTRLSAMAEIVDKCGYFFREPDFAHPDAVQLRTKAWRDDSPRAMAAVATELAAVSNWESASLGAAVVAAAEMSGIVKGQVQQALRFALTGTSIGAPVPETLQVLGKETVLRRLAMKH
jgi:glutamyl-tRNA synthetase